MATPERRRLPVLRDAKPEPDSACSGSGQRDARVSRRGFLRASAAGAAAAALTGPAAGCSTAAREELFQQHYKRLTEDDKRAIFERLEAEVRRTHGVDVRVEDPQPMGGVQYAYALNLSYCVGCRRCEWACAEENNTSRHPEIHYIRVLQMEKGSLDVERSDSYYEGTVPKDGKYYMPVQCHQCENPPCVRACPVRATWREPDGIIVVDYGWCIGCRYCEAACPYYARRFNFAEPSIRPSEINPKQGYLSNRLRPIGVMEKCTFCLHRTRNGLNPACLEVCPTGARKFGNLLDPQSPVRQVLEHKRVYVFREGVGTHPRFFYFFD